MDQFCKHGYSEDQLKIWHCKQCSKDKIKALEEKLADMTNIKEQASVEWHQMNEKLKVAVEALEGVKSEYQGYKNAVDSHYSQDWYPEIKMDADKIETDMYVAMEFNTIADKALTQIKAK